MAMGHSTTLPPGVKSSGILQTRVMYPVIVGLEAEDRLQLAQTIKDCADVFYL